MPPRIVGLMVAAALTILATSDGCGGRSADVAREAADRQARQNEVVAQVQSDAAQAVRQMAAEQSRTRQQGLALQRDVQAERQRLADGWNDLEAERQAIAQSRVTESFLEALVSGGGGALAGLLALAFAWTLACGLSRRDDSDGACQLLVAELLAEEPLLPHELLSAAQLPRDGEPSPILPSLVEPINPEPGEPCEPHCPH